MLRKRHWHTFMLVTGLLIGTVLLLSTQPVSASSPWAKWKVTVTYPNKQLAMDLIVQLGHTTASGQQVIDQEKTVAVSCVAVGSPVIEKGQMVLDGSSYFECSVPSIQAEVLQMTGGGMFIPDACPAKRPYIAGFVAPAASPALAAPSNPVFFRDDIRLNAPLDVANQQLELDVRFGQDSATSGTFALHAAGHSLAAMFDKSGPGTFTPLFRADGVSLGATPATVSGPIMISTLASTVYLGYSPVLGEYFEGTVGPLVGDPVCPTTG